MSKQIPWLRVFVEGVVIVGGSAVEATWARAGAGVSTFLSMFACVKTAKTRNEYARIAKFFPDLRYFDENRGSQEKLCKPEVAGSIPAGSIRVKRGDC